MPRKIEKEREVQEIRADWYTYHFQHRQFALACSAEMQERVARACLQLPRPALSLFGGENYPLSVDYLFGDDFKDRVHVAGLLGLEVEYLCWWYWSESGWDSFQKQWAELPEVVHMPCVQLEVVHSLPDFRRSRVGAK